MYYIKSVAHAFNNHVSKSAKPCNNKAIHVLLMHGFVTLKATIFYDCGPL